jgi:deazaflavin-dependent oxidoreductase (nitroreductase family)
VNAKLTTIGRKSGKPREVSLYAFEDGDRLVIVGSWGGSPRDPAWVLNLRGNADATVRRGKKVQSVRAREIPEGDDERERLWDLVCDAFPMYRTYQRKTSRLIPLFVLEPAS